MTGVSFTNQYSEEEVGWDDSTQRYTLVIEGTGVALSAPTLDELYGRYATYIQVLDDEDEDEDEDDDEPAVREFTTETEKAVNELLDEAAEVLAFKKS